jgi:nicotinate-nucleotide adenylyltransferase
MKLGIFGGTFDPPHLGHLILAEEAYCQLKLDQVLWVLTQNPPHKLGEVITDIAHRQDMVSAAIGDNQKFSLSFVDIKRPPPHYAVDTVASLQADFPKATLIYLMGADSLENLPKWHQPKKFVSKCHFLGVMRRSGTDYDTESLEAKIPGIGSKIRFFDTPLIDISGSQIRLRISEGRAYRYYLSHSVYQLIKSRKLYGKKLN